VPFFCSLLTAYSSPFRLADFLIRVNRLDSCPACPEQRRRASLLPAYLFGGVWRIHPPFLLVGLPAVVVAGVVTNSLQPLGAAKPSGEDGSV